MGRFFPTIALLFAICCGFNIVFSQTDTLLVENFEQATHQFSLNVAGPGTTPNTNNTWLVNNAYTGGTASITCFGFPISYTFADIPDQPATVTNSPRSAYLHISSDAALASGVDCATYTPADGTCIPTEVSFVRMTNPISTVPYINVRLSFSWLSNMSGSAYGQVWYSTNNGTSWTAINQAPTFLNSQLTWTNSAYLDNAFNNQASLLFGVTFTNNQASNGGEPALSLDEFMITGVPTCTVVQMIATDTICAGDSILLGGAFQMTGGTYVDSIPGTPCDTVLTTELTLIPRDTIDSVAGLCDGDSVFLGGAYQTQAGIYVDFLPTPGLCDQVRRTTVNLLPTFLTQMADTICEGDSIFLGGSWQTQAGLYNDVLISSLGCDSTVVTDLVVESVPTASINTNGSTLSSNLVGNSYQWFECFPATAIPGATGSTFMPTVSGSYAVAVTLDGCTSVSTCEQVIVGRRETTLPRGWRVFPNPAVELLRLDFGGAVAEVECVLRDVQGRALATTVWRGQSGGELDLGEFAAGVYMLDLRVGSGEYHYLVVRQ